VEFTAGAVKSGGGARLAGVIEDRRREALRMLLAQHLSEHAEGVTPPLLAGPYHTGQDLLGVRPVPGAVATPDLAGDDGGPDRLFGPPVRSLDVFANEEGEEVVALAHEVLGEAPVGWMDDPAGKGAVHPGFQPPARDSETVWRDLARRGTFAQLECGGEDPSYGMREARLPALSVLEQMMRSSQQMGQTGLVFGSGEAPIGCPAVALEHAVELRGEDRRRLLETAAGQDRVDRDLVGDEDPQPVQETRDLPSGLVGCDDWRAADDLDQPPVSWLGGASQAPECLTPAAAADGETEGDFVEGDELSVGDAESFVEIGGQRHGSRAEVDSGGTDRLGGLSRMASTHGPTAAGAAPEMQAKASHVRSHGRNVDLVLLDDALGFKTVLARAMRTAVGQRHIDGLVDMIGNRASCPGPVVLAWPATGLAWFGLRSATREGCRLSLGGTLSLLQLLLECAEPLAQLAVLLV